MCYNVSMILEEFDKEQNAVINPDAFGKKIPDFPAVTISCFSNKLFHRTVEVLQGTPIDGLKDVYRIAYGGKDFAFYQSPAGAPACVMKYEELRASGMRTLILYGMCGVLGESLEDESIIIPTGALRDEGTSYHYMPASDTVGLNDRFMDLFIDVLHEAECSYTQGLTWTTDAPYRETESKVNRRKEQGAVCVEMECAAMAAAAQFRNTDFFTFFYAADSLAGSEWTPRSLVAENRTDDQTRISFLAFELGLKILSEN